MKTFATIALLVVALAPSANAAALDAETNPLGKVIELMDSLTAKITADGEAEAKAYHEYMEWCDDETKNLGFEIKTLTSQKEKLEATIQKATADIEEGETKIADLAAGIATAEEELANATLIRKKENEEFLAAEKELVDSIDVLDRAIAILEREMAKNPALVQVDNTNLQRLVQSVSAVIDAAALAGNDRKTLIALVQSKQEPEAEGEEEAEDDE